MKAGVYSVSARSLDATTEYLIEAHPTESFEPDELKCEVARLVREDVHRKYKGAPAGIPKLVRHSTVVIKMVYEMCAKHGQHANGCPDEEVQNGDSGAVPELV